MSRIGREPIAIPEGVTITVDGSNVTVKGKLGTLTKSFHKGLSFEEKDGKFLVTRPNDSIEMRMNHGTARALINDMVKGVSEGFKKVLEVKGVGYRAEMKGNDLVLYVGHSHADVIPAMDGVKMTIDTKNLWIIVEGIDKQKVGQQAAVIRETKKPECYHGKGIRYQGEVVVLRQPASAKKSA
ncbi:50S ribosomal protein L6 [Treponema rectale]|uniref:50S ribosomal protein L6 n=1 Tax=Treponema rectale TaxID=744512 RepID=A0A7M1XK81_9SPIR|nr:50S ribosomal protein L6 [Treponema rectale]